jgi:hypothetical protein
MIPDTEITARLKRLERDNRRLKMLGAAALVLAAVLGAIAATRPVPDKITAHELDVVDEAGRVRVKVSTTPYSASVDVLDEQGDKAATMNVFPGFSSISAGKDGGDVAALTGSTQSGATVGVGYTPELSAAIAGKSGKALIDALKAYRSRLASGPSAGMAVLPSGAANLTVQDAQGFRMDLGSTDTVTPATGETQKTSAASIIMFGNDMNHHVIWKAP